jgi:hypothetical protein
MFVHPSQVAEIMRRHPQVRRARLVVSGEMANDVMTLVCEVDQPSAASELAPAMVASMRDVTKLRGEVSFVAAGALPNDGKEIEDARRYERWPGHGLHEVLSPPGTLARTMIGQEQVSLIRRLSKTCAAGAGMDIRPAAFLTGTAFLAQDSCSLELIRLTFLIIFISGHLRRIFPLLQACAMHRRFPAGAPASSRPFPGPAFVHCQSRGPLSMSTERIPCADLQLVCRPHRADWPP